MKSRVYRAAALLAILALPGCATILRGSKATYRISSTPGEAAVALSTGATCVTPCKLKLKRKDGFTAVVSKAGYETHTAQVDSKLSAGGGAAAAGNILAGGIIGGIVDGSKGSLNSFRPNKLDVTLVPTGSTLDSSSDDAARGR